MKPITLVATLLLPCLFHSSLCAQDMASLSSGTDKIASRYLDAVADKSGSLSQHIDKQNAKYLSRFQREEARLYKKLAGKDSTAAAKALADQGMEELPHQNKGCRLATK